jgi:arabinofuranosyltransferase
MTAFMVLCFLLPAALVLQAWLDRDAAAGKSGFSRRLVDSPKPTTVAWLLLLGAGCIVAATSVAAVLDERPFLFDDSFISYRYAKNLATGGGLAWNPGESPSEGYTNLLLVLLVTPVIKLGGDPLAAARVLSFAAAAGMVWVVFSMVRREFATEVPRAAIVALAILTFSTTAELTMLGLETVAFAFALLLAYDWSQRYYATQRESWLLAAGAMSFVAFTLRPEALFLPLAILAAQVLLEWNEPRRLLRLLGLLTASFGVPLALYLGWKLWYFGSVIPNPALVKMPGQGLVRPRGLTSIGNFLLGHQKIVLLAGLSLLLPRGRGRAALTASLVVVAYLLFYLRVDTLMDMHQRFLYPAFPFLLVIALPALRVFVDALLDWKQVTPVRLALGLSLFVVVFYANPGQALRRVAGGPTNEQVTDREVHQASVVLRRVGTALATYGQISDVTIGSTDAGLLPYFSGARHVDMAGLATRFIAEHRDVTVAANYFFGQQPDLIIVRAKIGGALVDYEHGVLGDYPRWSHNPGWNAYASAGAVHNGPRHDLYFYLRRDSRHFPALEQLIHDSIADPGIAPLQAVLGARP